MSATQKKNYLTEAWLVLLLALLFGAALAGVQAALSPKIEQNKLQETLGQISALVPGAETGVPETLDGTRVYRALTAGKQTAGWVLPARGQGFADTIELLIGLNAEATQITGLYVLEQKETPGLGDNIRAPGFQSQFKGKPAGSLQVVKTGKSGPHDIHALTGATISSDSVVKIVNRAAAAFHQKLNNGKGAL
jgi:electron transport complex protein RnfG